MKIAGRTLCLTHVGHFVTYGIVYLSDGHVLMDPVRRDEEGRRKDLTDE